VLKYGCVESLPVQQSLLDDVVREENDAVLRKRVPVLSGVRCDVDKL
jgi:hypothetical protein